MSQPEWKQILDIFEQAVELPHGERRAFLSRICDDGQTLRAVEDLLAVDREGDPGPTATSEPATPHHLPPGRPEPGPQPAEPAPELQGEIGGYRLLRQVGQGGMSTVYLASRDDDTFRRRVVIKLVRQGMEREAILRRLRTERQILAGLDHPNIARLYDGGSTERGLPYFVMEHVDGLPIDTFCQRNRLPISERLQVFRKVCS
ncbi:MAG: protein kinase, partial [Holophagales bacterium]|nr:protein kinase [Holophagales bacterium]